MTTTLATTAVFPRTFTSLVRPASAFGRRNGRPLHRSGFASRSSPTHLLTLADLSREQILHLVGSAATFKRQVKAREADRPCKIDGEKAAALGALRGESVTMLFSKKSTRTRIATETAAAALGAHAIYLGAEEKQNETLEDTARVVSSMTGAIMARVNGHAEVETLATHSTVPVINALSDKYHPTQILADLLTLHEVYSPSSARSSQQEQLISFPKDLTVAWVGDANNILNELLVSLPKLGINIHAATPQGYSIDKDVTEIAKEDAASTGANVKLCKTPEDAVDGADVIVTDTWVSMGQEQEKAKRLKDFEGFRVTMDLARRGRAKPDWKFMHCLPRKQEEVDDEVFYSDRSLVFQEAENRKWTILAALHALMTNSRIQPIGFTNKAFSSRRTMNSTAC